MGLIARESPTTVKPGSIASGEEMEKELDKVFALIGETTEGDIDNANLAANANFDGAKMTATSITTAKIQDGSIEGAKINNTILTTSEFTAASVMQPYIDTDTGTETFDTTGSYVDVPGITAWTVTPGSTDNYIRLDCSFSFTTTDTDAIYDFAFSVNAVQTPSMGQFTFSTTYDLQTYHFSWSGQAPSASSIIIKPVYSLLAATTGSTVFAVMKKFTGLIVPVK